MDFTEFEENNGKAEEVKPCCTDLVHITKEEKRNPDAHLGGVESLTIYDGWNEVDDFYGFGGVPVAGRLVK